MDEVSEMIQRGTNSLDLRHKAEQLHKLTLAYRDLALDAYEYSDFFDSRIEKKFQEYDETLHKLVNINIETPDEGETYRVFCAREK